MRRTMLLLAAVSLAAVAHAKAAKTAKSTDAAAFYVYQDKGSHVNHYAPSGWMGDYGDIKLNDASTDNPADGRTAIKIDYSAKVTQNMNWAGVFWQNPPNNWGTRKGGYDLTGFKRLTFWARGTTGKERIAEFKVGGITGEFGDSGQTSIGPIQLETTWKKYTIELAEVDLHSISGGFCWSASRDDNPEGFTIFLDEIRFEK